MLVMGELTGLQPNAVLGFHIHEYGDCSAPDGSSAGEHFAPEGERHGAPTAPEYHVGDLGNVRRRQRPRDGQSAHEGCAAVGSDAMLLGRALVVHEDPDDLHSQPSGNSGRASGVASSGCVGSADTCEAAVRRPCQLNGVTTASSRGSSTDR